MITSRSQIVESFNQLDEAEQKTALTEMARAYANKVARAAFSNVVEGLDKTAPTPKPETRVQTQASQSQPRQTRARKSVRRPRFKEREVPEIGSVSSMTDVIAGLVNKNGELTVKQAIEWVQQHIDVMPVRDTSPSKVEMAIRNAFNQATTKKLIRHMGTAKYASPDQNDNANRNSNSGTQQLAHAGQ